MGCQHLSQSSGLRLCFRSLCLESWCSSYWPPTSAAGPSTTQGQCHIMPFYRFARSLLCVRVQCTSDTMSQLVQGNVCFSTCISPGSGLRRKTTSHKRRTRRLTSYKMCRRSSQLQEKGLPMPVRHDGCLDVSQIFPELLSQVTAALPP